MAIAVDQARLRYVVHTLLGDDTLNRAETTTILHIVQLAAGADFDGDDPDEISILHSIAQHLCTRVGLEPRSIEPVVPIVDEVARVAWMHVIARELRTRGARELAYSLALLLSLADLRLAKSETEWLEDLQRTLGVDDVRATDLVVLVTNSVASEAPEPSRRQRAAHRRS